jgi:hypothetical protein
LTQIWTAKKTDRKLYLWQNLKFVFLELFDFLRAMELSHLYTGSAVCLQRQVWRSGVQDTGQISQLQGSKDKKNNDLGVIPSDFVHIFKKGRGCDSVANSLQNFSASPG